MIADIANRVSAFFVANGWTTAISYGWEKHGQQINQGPGGADRIVFRPGDDAGKAGTFGPPKRANAFPRQLAAWSALLYVYVWARDETAPQDDAAQVRKVVELNERLFRAVHMHYSGYYRFSDPQWVGPVEYRYGRELRVSLTLHIPILDGAGQVVTPDPSLTKTIRPNH